MWNSQTKKKRRQHKKVDKKGKSLSDCIINENREREQKRAPHPLIIFAGIVIMIIICILSPEVILQTTFCTDSQCLSWKEMKWGESITKVVTAKFMLQPKLQTNKTGVQIKRPTKRKWEDRSNRYRFLSTKFNEKWRADGHVKYNRTSSKISTEDSDKETGAAGKKKKKKKKDTRSRCPNTNWGQGMRESRESRKRPTSASWLFEACKSCRE